MTIYLPRRGATALKRGCIRTRRLTRCKRDMLWNTLASLGFNLIRKEKSDIDSKTPRPKEDPTISPIYPATLKSDRVVAAFTGKGTSSQNDYFSFHRPSSKTPGQTNTLALNLRTLAGHLNFDPTRLTWPNGNWPHSGHVIKAEECSWVSDPSTGGLVPITHGNRPLTYDGIVTRTSRFVLGVQGADCPSVFLCDTKAVVIGMLHAGWRPVVRGIIHNGLSAMLDLGANASDIVAFISPGVGDNYNEFQWDDKMEQKVKAVFIEAGREELLQEHSIRYRMTEQEKLVLSSVLRRECSSGTTFRLVHWVAEELRNCGVLPVHIIFNHDSTIVDRYPTEAGVQWIFRYHSYRRERPSHGLAMSVLFIKHPISELAHSP